MWYVMGGSLGGPLFNFPTRHTYIIICKYNGAPLCLIKEIQVGK